MAKSVLFLVSNILYTLLLLLAFESFAATALIPANETDKLALLALKDRIREDPLGVMVSWNESFDFCDWRGVSCSNRHEGRVTELDLGDQKLVGSLPPHIGNLSFLRQINLSSNSFEGEIPEEIGRLFRLRSLDLSYNSFQGKIPANLSSCSDLEYIIFTVNELTGEIPIELEVLVNSLKQLSLSANQLTGSIPRWLGNASSLVQLSLRGNNLHGSIPNELGRLGKLQFLQLSENDLSGTVPLSIFNLSSLFLLAVTDNRLHGSLPSDIGFTLPNLQYLYLPLNSFYGEIPPSLVNATKLEFFEMGSNNFSGVVPSNLGSLSNLQVLSLHNNQLGIAEGEDLGFITSLANCSNLRVLQLSDNRFRDELPASIANLSTKLQRLTLGSNLLSGKLPDYIGNLADLTVLDISAMDITGEIPPSVANLKNLYHLGLYMNRISGSVPSFLGNFSDLDVLDLSRNNLSGLIPHSLGNCLQLQYLGLENNYLTGKIPEKFSSLSQVSRISLNDNSLTGELPLEVGNMTRLVELYVSNNQLSGKIPGTLGKCLMLEKLQMDGNLFEGGIPSSFSTLKSLRVLDLSRNNLSDKIPEYLEDFDLLQYLNLSFNNFAGELPSGGVFGNASGISVAGNQRLCGGVHQLGLPLCEIQDSKRKAKFQLPIVIAIAVLCLFLLIMLVLLIIFLYPRKTQRRGAHIQVEAPEGFPLISYSELSNATNGFSPANVIGEGGSGTVYRGNLGREGMSVAVKVINLFQKGASKSFIAECEALKGIRHRNLIKIVTVCSSIDHKGNDFMALVYEFMLNGSLEEWLHPSDEDRDRGLSLSFIQRLNIAIEVASAIEYLHDYCIPPIVHGDLKPSNVLLDEDMVAHVGDFGLARLLITSNEDQNQSVSIGLKGTIGYIAPEYGMSRNASKPGDVYAFGILLLEMITGKRPTDAVFKDGSTIHHFTKTNLSERVVDFLDPSLLGEIQDAEYSRKENQETRVGVLESLIAIAKIGILCSVDSPNERSIMKEAAAELCAIRDRFLGNR